MEIKPKSVFRRGAEDGIWFGLYLSVLFIFAAVAINIPLLGHIATLMALAVPVYTFFTLRRGFIDNGYFYTFSEVWTHGLTLFLCGTLIMALTIVVYLTWINPSFIYDQCQIAITAYKQIGGEMGNEIAATLEKAINQKLLPSPLSIASNLISLGVFSGSILSMILAPFIRLCRPKQKNNENNNNITQH